MSSTFIRIAVAVGIVATFGINVIAPRIGVEHAPATPAASATPIPDGPRLIPVPSYMR